MEELIHRFIIKSYDTIDQLNQEDAYLLAQAREGTQNAYAPYSQFQVSAFARLSNGKTVSGTNQENASYPAGICAERSLLSAASSIYPGVSISSIAISYNNLNGKSDKPASPCGICRQSLAEHANRFETPIKLILSGMDGKVQIIENCMDLLPLAFGAVDLT